MADTTGRKRLDTLLVWGVDTDQYGENYNDGDIGMIAASIRRFGFNRAVGLWKDGLVLDGNHATMALRQIKQQGKLSKDEQWPPANVVADKDGYWWVNWYPLVHLAWEDALAFAIAANRAAARASQDNETLARYLLATRDYDQAAYAATGYDDEDLARLLESPPDVSTLPPGVNGAGGEDGYFDATKLPGAESGALKPTFLIYIALPDKDTFIRMYALLTGKPPVETEAFNQTMAQVAWTTHQEHLERLEALFDEVRN